MEIFVPFFTHEEGVVKIVLKILVKSNRSKVVMMVYYYIDISILRITGQDLVEVVVRLTPLRVGVVLVYLTFHLGFYLRRIYHLITVNTYGQ